MCTTVQEYLNKTKKEINQFDEYLNVKSTDIINEKSFDVTNVKNIHLELLSHYYKMKSLIDNLKNITDEVKNYMQNNCAHNFILDRMQCDPCRCYYICTLCDKQK